MNIKDNDTFLLRLNEDTKSYSTIHIDWKTGSINIIERFDNSHDNSIPNKFIKKAWIVDGDIEDKISAFIGESDDEFYDNLEYIKSLPIFDENKEEIISELYK
jgi:hypothetical protein